MISQSALAKLWGVSQPYVAKLKAKGMPLTSEEDANAWREQNRVRRYRKPFVEKGHPDQDAKATDFAKVAGVELVDEVKRLAQLASEISAKIDITKPGERSSLIADYTKVIDQLRKLRSDRPDIEEKEGKMVTIEEADKILSARDNALVPLLKSMPKRLAPICANSTAAQVEAEVEKEVGQLMRQVEAAV